MNAMMEFKERDLMLDGVKKRTTGVGASICRRLSRFLSSEHSRVQEEGTDIVVAWGFGVDWNG